MAQYGYRDVTDVSLIDLATGETVITMPYLQTSSQSFGNEIVYSIGGRGAPKRVGFQSGNAMTMEMVSSVITPEMLGIMFGTDVVKGVQYVPETEIIDATSNVFNLAATPYTSDLTTYPVKVAYSVDGTVPTVNLTKVTGTPAETEFALSGLTVTVNSSTYSAGGTFIVTYYKASTASNKRVIFRADRYSKAYKLTGKTLWKNEEDELFYKCIMEVPKLQITIDGNTLNSAMNGDPTTPMLKGEALIKGRNKSLIIYDIDEGAGIANPE